MAKIAFCELEEWEKKIFKRELKGNKLVFFDCPSIAKNAGKIKDAEILCIFIYSKITREVLDMMPKLKYIVTMSTGFDHIDLEECRKRKISVSNIPTYGENTVAEHTFALILAISRRIPESIIKTRRGDFSLEGLRGFDLKGRILGIVGLGHIGQRVAKIAKGFEMDVIVFDVHKDAKLAKSIGFKYVDLDTLLRSSDIISLHLPENKHTHHMIDAKAFAKMKKCCVLVNTSRGSIVDTAALIEALDDDTIAYAGLDVLEGECYIKEEKQLLKMKDTCDLKAVLRNNILLKKERVLITPHNAFNSDEALLRIVDTTVDNVKSFLKGKRKNVVG